MAQSKKKSKKSSSKKKSRKIAKKNRSTRRRAESKPLLTVKEKQSLLKPGADLDEMTLAFLAGWEQIGRKLSVPDVTPAKLRSALRRAERTQARLDREVAKSEARLAPLRDEVLAARHAAFDMVLAGNKLLAAIGERHPDVISAFRPFTGLLARRFPRPIPRPAPDAGGA